MNDLFPNGASTIPMKQGHCLSLNSIVFSWSINTLVVDKCVHKQFLNSNCSFPYALPRTHFSTRENNTRSRFQRNDEITKNDSKNTRAVSRRTLLLVEAGDDLDRMRLHLEHCNDLRLELIVHPDFGEASFRCVTDKNVNDLLRSNRGFACVSLRRCRRCSSAACRFRRLVC
jgi:hypothetical protein